MISMQSLWIDGQLPATASGTCKMSGLALETSVAGVCETARHYSIGFCSPHNRARMAHIYLPRHSKSTHGLLTGEIRLVAPYRRANPVAILDVDARGGYAQSIVGSGRKRGALARHAGSVKKSLGLRVLSTKPAPPVSCASSERTIAPPDGRQRNGPVRPCLGLVYPGR